jgi:hypothetical protein
MSEGAANSEEHVNDEFVNVHDELANARIDILAGHSLILEQRSGPGIRRGTDHILASSSAVPSRTPTDTGTDEHVSLGI